MIETEAIRKRVLDYAVLGYLTKDFISNSDIVDELSRLMDRKIETVNDDECLYEIKKGWAWIRLNQLGDNDKHSFADGPFGSNLKREHYTDKKEVRIIQLSNVGEHGWKNENEKYTTYEHLKTIERSEVEPGNIVIAKMMPAGRAIVVPDICDKYVLSSDCIKFVPFKGLSKEYICLAINSNIFRKQVLQDVHGIGRERTSLSKIKTYMIPLPTIEEQKLIVEKVNSIFALLDGIDILQADYAKNKEVLKSKLIDAAISGHLSKQQKEDGTAEELLEKIQEEKSHLEKEGKIKKSKKLPEITPEEIPFEIPKNWNLIRLGEVLILINGDRGKNYPAKSKLSFEKGIPFISAINMDNKSISKDKLLYLTQKQYDLLGSGKLEKGDLVVCIRGSLGKNCIYPYDEGAIASSLVICRAPVEQGIIHKYISYYFDSGLFNNEIHRYDKGSAQPNLGARDLEKFIVPLPPLAEQNRIVETLDKLLSNLS